ncbi:DUF397 domain-containing protein [Streptomyces sp. ASQP_92]|uniref:DUF397 domain-containing protein n=1 Tax=Streptomyces sp. ASQP_92 TaxID=2979116 RepID=UPI0021BEFC98|nr:DUF397 domain-containing protein [Streptomyces sp. ASQP_92]MCT9091259.1 DUF397 domain-containing protein [Streptomyces sp. ASQP_92]
MSTSQLAWFKSSYSSAEGDSCVEVALGWRKSTYSGSSGDDCVEVAECWSKSSYSSGDGDDCVEVAATPAVIHVRDSKDKAGPQLTLSPSAWGEFVGYAGGRG